MANREGTGASGKEGDYELDIDHIKPAINANIANATSTAWDKSEMRATVLRGILSTTIPP